MKIYSRFHLVLVVALATTALLVSAVTAKTELITNGTFTTDTTGWYNLPSTVGSISYTDSQGHTAIGAANVQNLSTSTGTTSNGGAQCISLPLPIASYYTVEGWVKVPTQSNSTAVGYIRLGFYSSTNCSGSQLNAFNTNTVNVGSDWTFIKDTVDTSSVNTAQSVEVRLYIRKTGSTSAYAYFDDISFFPSTATAVTLSSFTAHSDQGVAQPERALAVVVGVGLATVGAGIVALRRRRGA